MTKINQEKSRVWEKYLSHIEGIPLPTDEQIKNYVRKAIQMHSWYKRLSGGDQFVFALRERWFDGSIKSPIELQCEGNLRLYWADTNGDCPMGWYNIYEELHPEICNLAIKVCREDYHTKEPQMIANTKSMRDLIRAKRCESRIISLDTILKKE